MPRTGSAEKDGTVELPALLDLKAATPLAECLLSLRGQPVTIDASSVEKIGGQCLQVLLSAVATWKADGHPLQFVAPSESFDSGLQLLGLSRDILINQDIHP